MFKYFQLVQGFVWIEFDSDAGFCRKRAKCKTDLPTMNEKLKKLKESKTPIKVCGCQNVTQDRFTPQKSCAQPCWTLFLLKKRPKVDLFSFSAPTKPPAEWHLGIHNNVFHLEESKGHSIIKVALHCCMNNVMKLKIQHDRKSFLRCFILEKIPAFLRSPRRAPWCRPSVLGGPQSIVWWAL